MEMIIKLVNRIFKRPQGTIKEAWSTRAISTGYLNRWCLQEALLPKNQGLNLANHQMQVFSRFIIPIAHSK